MGGVMPKKLKKRDATRVAKGNQQFEAHFGCRCAAEDTGHREVVVHRTKGGRGEVGRLVDKHKGT